MDPVVKEMHIRLIRYFETEKSESALFLLAGGAAIVASFFLWRSGGAWKLDLRPMIWPLLGIAAIQLGVGGTVYTRTDAQVTDLTAKLERSPADFAAEETARMTTVMKSFRLYRWIEIALIVSGAALAFFFRQRPDWAVWAGWPAVGAGLMLQATVMLAFDFYAERRGEIYLEAIRRLLP